MVRWILAALLMHAANVSLAQSVSIDYDQGVDFAALQSYAWADGTPVLNRLSHQRVVNAVDYHLTMKGVQEVEENPDVYLVYHASAEKEIRVTDWGYSGIGRSRWAYGTRDIDVNTVIVGTLVVDMLNSDQKLIWRGIGRGTVSSKPEKNEKKINKAVQKMFKKFPPKKR